MPTRHGKKSVATSGSPNSLDSVHAEIADGANTLAALAAYSKLPSVANILKMAAVACVQQSQVEGSNSPPEPTDTPSGP